MEKSTSLFFLAAARVASPSRKPTVVMLWQSAATIAWMLSANSEGALDSTSPVWTDMSSSAFTRPSCEVWLNDLSSKPPESDTMQALKSANCSDGALELSVADGESEPLASFPVDRSPQPARTNTAMAHIAETRAVFFTAPLLI